MNTGTHLSLATLHLTLNIVKSDTPTTAQHLHQYMNMQLDTAAKYTFVHILHAYLFLLCIFQNLANSLQVRS